MTGAVFVPLFLVALPAALADPNTDTNAVFQAVVVVSAVPGVLVGGALYVVFLPLEWAVPPSGDVRTPAPLAGAGQGRSGSGAGPERLTRPAPRSCP